MRAYSFTKSTPGRHVARSSVSASASPKHCAERRRTSSPGSPASRAAGRPRRSYSSGMAFLPRTTVPPADGKFDAASEIFPQAGDERIGRLPARDENRRVSRGRLGRKAERRREAGGTTRPRRFRPQTTPRVREARRPAGRPRPPPPARRRTRAGRPSSRRIRWTWAATGAPRRTAPIRSSTVGGRLAVEHVEDGRAEAAGGPAAGGLVVAQEVARPRGRARTAARPAGRPRRGRRTRTRRGPPGRRAAAGPARRAATPRPRGPTTLGRGLT